ncbi:hypothetical protein SRHO_G00036540 [Serrasalmus rhombeus]
MEQRLDVEGKVPRQGSTKKPVTTAELRKGRLLTGSPFISSQNSAVPFPSHHRCEALLLLRRAASLPGTGCQKSIMQAWCSSPLHKWVYEFGIPGWVAAIPAMPAVPLGSLSSSRLQQSTVGKAGNWSPGD